MRFCTSSWTNLHCDGECSAVPNRKSPEIYFSRHLIEWGLRYSEATPEDYNIIFTAPNIEHVFYVSLNCSNY